jgi:transcriptional regulator with GAF, ATPase, and Fis domain
MELVARSIHSHSTRERHPFVAINCGALSEAIVDSELSGHCRGAFTGAFTAHRGMLVEADGRRRGAGTPGRRRR